MSRHLALLRAINVGGRNKVPMARLREVASGLGFTDVATYIASGNLLFSSPKKPNALAGELSRACASEFGFDLDVVVADLDLVRHAVEDHPFADGEPKMVHAGFCDREVTTGVLEKLLAVATPNERYAVDGTLIFADYGPGGLHASRSAGRIAPALKPGFCTMRNLATTRTLLGLLQG